MCAPPVSVEAMKPYRRTTTMAIVVAALLLVSACGSGDGAQDAAPRATPTGSSDASSASPEVPSPARTNTAKKGTSDAAVPETLDFRASTVSGSAFDGASVAGRPVLLWFWAPWCPTCRGQIPQVETLAADYGSAMTVIGVGSLDSAEAIADFADEVDDFTQLEDVGGELYRRFGIVEQSSFVLLDAGGEVAFEHRLRRL